MSNSNKLVPELFYALILGSSLLFTIHLDTGYQLLKRVALNLLLLILVYLWGRDFFAKKTAKLVISPLYKPLALIALAGLLSLAVAFNQFEGLDLWLQWLDVCLLAFIVANCVDKRTLYRSLYLMIGGGWLIALYGIFQELGFDWVVHVAPHTPFSVFGNVNWAAQYLLVLCPLALVVLIKEQSLPSRIFAGGGLALLLVHLFLTHARGGWLALTVTFGYVLYLILFRRQLPQVTPALRKTAIMSCLGLFVFSVFILILKPDLSRRLFLSSNNTRLLIWNSSFKIWRDYPLLGVGLGNFKIQYPRYRLTQERDVTSKDVQVDQTHNEYLQFLTDMGIVGFAALIYFFLVIRKTSHAAQAQLENPDYLLILGCVGVIIGILIDSLVDFPLQNPASLMGFILAAAYLVKLADLETTIEVTPQPSQRFLFYAALFSLALFSISFQVKRLASDYWFNRGQYEFQAENLPASVVLLNQANASYPFNFRVWLILGYVQNKQGNFAEAAKAYEKSLRLNPNYYLAHYQLGSVYLKLNRYQEALTEYDAALKLVPDFDLALAAKAETTRRQGLPEANAAAADMPNLEEALSTKQAPLPDNIRRQIDEAQKLEKAGNYQQAIVIYQDVYRQDSGLIMIKYSLGMDYLYLNQLDKAQEFFSAVANTEELPPSPRSEAFSQMGYVCYLKQDFVNAEKYFLQAITLEPKSLRGHQFLGNLYYGQGRKAEALKAWQQALAIYPDNPVLVKNVQSLSQELAAK